MARALAKNPSDRFADANELRSELLTTAQELGLEHADSTQAPTLDELRRTAGPASPSGRLVIDLATLRHMQAANSGDEVSHQDAPIRREIARMNVPLDNSPAAAASRKRRSVAGDDGFNGNVTNRGGIALVEPSSQAPLAWLPNFSDSNSRSVAFTIAGSSPRKNQRRPAKKKESKFGSFVNKVRRIFKR